MPKVPRLAPPSPSKSAAETRRIMAALADAASERRHRAALLERLPSSWSRRFSRRSAPTSASTRSRRRSSSDIQMPRRWPGHDRRARAAESVRPASSAPSRDRCTAWPPSSCERTAVRCLRDHGRARRAAGRGSQDRQRRARARARRPGPAGRSPRAAGGQPDRHRAFGGSRSRRTAVVRGAMPPADWTRTSDTLILHGRRICRPRRCATGAPSPTSATTTTT